MAIEVNAVNEWVQTPEGSEWLESQKAALVMNRDSVLSELKKARGDYSTLEQQHKETDERLNEERQILSKLLVDDKICSLLNDAHVFEAVIPTVADRIKAQYGVSVKASGLDRVVCGLLRDDSGNEKEASLEEVIAAWKTLPESLSVMRNMNSGGGAIGNKGHGYTRPPELGRLSGRQLANTSDSDFEAWRQQEISKAGKL